MKYREARLMVPERTLRWAACAYLVLLTYALLTPHPLWEFGETGKQAEETIDASVSGITQHLVAYGILALLLIWGYGPLARGGAVLCVLFAAVHAVAAEGLQYFVPDRYADLPDALANLGGVGLGTLAAFAGTILRRRETNA